jgi:CheY-like chemotaxis protein
MGPIAKMLCVDDNLFVLQMIESFMEGHFQVTLADSAEEGLNMLEVHGPFDIVLSDYDMPGMKGVEFLCLVAERWPETIRILMSGGGADMDKVERAISAGHISRFLAKPYCMITLRDQLWNECNGGAAPVT